MRVRIIKDGKSLDFTPDSDTVVMIHVTEKDKTIIGNMTPEYTIYGATDENCDKDE